MNNKFNIIAVPRKEYLSKSIENLFLKKSVFDSIFFNSEKKTNSSIYKYHTSNLYVKKNIKFLKKKKEIYLKQISRTLNTLHNIKCDKNYWRIILDSWLVHVISSIKIRLDELKSLKKFENRLSIIENNCDYFFGNTGDLINKITVDDKFNQNFYSRIANHLKIKIIKKKPKNRIFLLEIKKNSLLIKLIRKILFIYARLFSPTLLVDSYFKNPVKIFFLSFGKIIILPSKILNSNLTNKINMSQRKKLGIKEYDEFDRVFNLFIKNFLPKSFLENYKIIRSDISQLSVYLNKAGTATGIILSDTYKILAAELYKNKKKYYGFQHGGYYGLQTLNLLEDIEKKNSTKYFYWNNKKGLGLNYLPVFKKISLKELNKNKKIVLYLSLQKKYNNRLEFQMDYSDNLKNINQYFKLYDNLNHSLKEHFFVKTIPNPGWWNSSKFWTNKYDSDIKIINNKSSKNTLIETKLLVTSQISTPFIEAMYTGIPIVVFAKLDEYSFKPNVKKLFLKLKKIGVIHDDPISCSKFINKNYSNLLSWWTQPYVQKEINKIRNLLFTDKKDYLKEILKELK